MLNLHIQLKWRNKGGSRGFVTFLHLRFCYSLVFLSCELSGAYNK